MNVLELEVYTPYLGSLSLVFIFSKSKGFQSGALLKIPLSSPSMEEFGLDFQK